MFMRVDLANIMLNQWALSCKTVFILMQVLQVEKPSHAVIDTTMIFRRKKKKIIFFILFDQVFLHIIYV